ncbi:MAG: hypothetical protein ACYCOO_00790 [Chitinophagaceae bacterium]
MKLKVFLMGSFLLTIIFWSVQAMAQCSVCTKTAQQLGPHAGTGLNSGILYLMGMPFAIVGFIGYHWWKSHKPSST